MQRDRVGGWVGTEKSAKGNALVFRDQTSAGWRPSLIVPLVRAGLRRVGSKVVISKKFYKLNDPLSHKTNAIFSDVCHYGFSPS